MASMYPLCMVCTAPVEDSDCYAPGGRYVHVECDEPPKDED